MNLSVAIPASGMVSAPKDTRSSSVADVRGHSRQAPSKRQQGRSTKYSAGSTPVRTGFYLGNPMAKTTKVDVKVDVASCLWALVMLVLIIVTY